MKSIVYTGRRVSIVIALLFVFAFTATAQSECPANLVCISPEAAQAALVAHKTVIAQTKELETLREAVQAQKDLTSDVKIELARVTGQLTAEQQQNVSNRAIITAMIPMLRVKKFGLINLF